MFCLSVLFVCLFFLTKQPTKPQHQFRLLGNMPPGADWRLTAGEMLQSLGLDPSAAANMSEVRGSLCVCVCVCVCDCLFVCLFIKRK